MEGGKEIGRGGAVCTKNPISCPFNGTTPLCSVSIHGLFVCFPFVIC